MWFNVFILFCVLVHAGALYEGDFCVKDGLAGICKGIEQCPPAIEDLKNRKIPQICGFVGTDSIVCCVDNSVTHLNPVATTTEKSYTPDYSGYSPDVPDYKDTNTQREDCEPVPPTYTIPKTGKRALDKCIEYQEKFVYPCEKGIALMPGSKSRGTHCHHSTTELIIGGEKAKEHEFPHMVMVGYGNSRGPLILQCGGAIISNTFVLTAGHCIASREQLNATYVVVGALNRTEARDPSKVYNIKNVIKHPLYFPPDKYNDIALFELERPIKLDQFTVPACLHVGDEVNDTRVLATGWGLTKDKDKTSESEVLQKVILEKFHDLECAGNFIPNRNLEQGFNSYTQTCYGHKTKARDTCNGDSGGPLQIKNQKIHCMYTVVGVTSFGRKCGEIDRPGMYTKVAPYVSWIEDIVWPEG